MCKGYTLVQMGVVLLIAGIITSLSIKLMEVKYNTEIRGNVARFAAVNDAVHSYRYKYGSLKALNSNEFINASKDLVNAGFLTKAQLNSKTIKDIDILQCRYDKNFERPPETGVIQFIKTQPPMLCITADKIIKEDACYIEVFLDDGIYNRGRIRSNDRSYDFDYPVPPDCKVIPTGKSIRELGTNSIGLIIE